MCSVNGIKVLLFIENFLFWLIGTGLIAVGAYLLIETNLPGILQFLSGAKTLCYIAIGAGTFLFILGFVGCCGAANHNDCLLKTYIVILVLFILLEIGVGVYIGLGFGNAQLEKIWDTTDETSKDVIHSTFKCCGFNSPEESYPSGTYPPSCQNEDRSAYYVVGCYSKLAEAINSLDIILLCVGASIALLEILGIIMSCFLACNKKQYQDNQVIPLEPTRGYRNGGYR